MHCLWWSLGANNPTQNMRFNQQQKTQKSKDEDDDEDDDDAIIMIMMVTMNMMLTMRKNEEEIVLSRAAGWTETPVGKALQQQHNQHFHHYHWKTFQQQYKRHWQILRSGNWLGKVECSKRDLMPSCIFLNGINSNTWCTVCHILFFSIHVFAFERDYSKYETNSRAGSRHCPIMMICGQENLVWGAVYHYKEGRQKFE